MEPFFSRKEKKGKACLAGGVFVFYLLMERLSCLGFIVSFPSLLSPLLFTIFTLFLSTTGNSQLILPFDPPL